MRKVRILEGFRGYHSFGVPMPGIQCEECGTVFMCSNDDESKQEGK